MDFLSAFMAHTLLTYFIFLGCLNVLLSFLKNRTGAGYMLIGLLDLAVAAWLYFASSLF